jgi:hypothetical protein
MGLEEGVIGLELELELERRSRTAVAGLLASIRGKLNP